MYKPRPALGADFPFTRPRRASSGISWEQHARTRALWEIMGRFHEFDLKNRITGL
jgi:hypothetical protein